MTKKLFFILLLSLNLNYAGTMPAERARGVFFSFGVGPRLPVGTFSGMADLGYGLNLEISYTDNEYIPFFVFGKVGYEQFPGSQTFYQATDYSTFSTTSYPVSFGVRYYFKPIMENIFLFMPLLEVSAVYNIFEKLHEFKPGANRSNFIEETSKLGFSAGAGISMFMMEILASYNYFETNQSVTLDLKIRLPLYVIY